MRSVWRLFLIFSAMVLIIACGGGSLPDIPAVPESIKEIPGAQTVLDELPESLEGLPATLEELGLPDISQIADIPQLEDLPAMQAPPGGIIFNGPTEVRLRPGEFMPGTDIQLTAISDQGAVFAIAGLRSPREIGDSLDFDGQWPGLDDTTYNLRTRIYRVGADSIRAAGVHQLTVGQVSPVETDAAMDDHATRFLYSSGAESSELFSGTTLGYIGANDRGGELSGLPAGDYPFRKIGDSIVWQGHLRSDIPVAYAARMLLYGENSARIGGVVRVSLPLN